MDQLKRKLQKKNFRKTIQGKIWDIANIIGNPFKLYDIDISKTDEDETHQRIRTRKGAPKKEEYMKTDDRNPWDPMMTRSKAKKKKRGT